jgi:hypothetical protein
MKSPLDPRRRRGARRHGTLGSESRDVGESPRPLLVAHDRPRGHPPKRADVG